MIISEITTLKDVLLKENHTIVICKSDASVIVSNDRGIVPLMQLLVEDKKQLQNSIIADKVIGKAAALLMVYAGVKEVYTPVISSPALEVFKNHNIRISYDNEVDRIVNRKGDGLCPMESLCLEINEPDSAFETLKRKLQL